MTQALAKDETFEAERIIDPRELRDTFGKFATGVTVVTCKSSDGKPHGATVNAFTSVSLDPPLAQITLIRGNKISQFLENDSFAINIMAADQLDVCMNFAGKPNDAPIDWCHDGPAPRLRGNAATIECHPWRTYDGGDHIIVIGEVHTIEITEKDPLLFISGKFHEVGVPAVAGV